MREGQEGRNTGLTCPRFPRYVPLISVALCLKISLQRPHGRDVKGGGGRDERQRLEGREWMEIYRQREGREGWNRRCE